MAAMNNVLAVILGGGRGARLYPLTKMRSKPAVPIAGKYRLIDIPISNCINSGYLPHRRVDPVQLGLPPSPHLRDLSVRRLPHRLGADLGRRADPCKSPTGTRARPMRSASSCSRSRSTRRGVRPRSWPATTSTAWIMPRWLDFHWEQDADITVAVQPVARRRSRAWASSSAHDDGRIVAFAEKPKDPELPNKMVSRDDPNGPSWVPWASTCSRPEVLIDLLTEHPDFDDFGSDVIPSGHRQAAVFGFDFDGYWEDIGTIRSFYETNLALTRPDAPFNFYDAQTPIYTHSALPARLHRGGQQPEGCAAGGGLRHPQGGSSPTRSSACAASSARGRSSRTRVVMGADYYERARQQEHPAGHRQNDAKLKARSSTRTCRSATGW